ncbi:hypothetical protein RSSM_00757 [Rhodopirellula sallentina SM41]|uniref:Uncharacterized protein n=1 Tax=Rhodopirellula sallentina SM41 TaxID=1263870 RepID=M5UP70_9BACT|nr:hypothetical protein RSSM_00757 [Rhodopirellula sallentina SM41]
MQPDLPQDPLPEKKADINDYGVFHSDTSEYKPLKRQTPPFKRTVAFFIGNEVR